MDPNNNSGIETTNPAGGDLTNPSGGLINILGPNTDLWDFLTNIIDLVVRVGAMVIVLALIYVGFLFATTSINPENKNKAREALLWTLVGALILLGAEAISLGIQATVEALST